MVEVLIPSNVDLDDSDLVDVADAEGLDTFLELLDDANLSDMLREDGPFTVFVPSDDAFKKLSKDVMDFLLSEQGATALKDLLMYHIVPEYWDTDDMEDEKSGFAVTTAFAQDVKLYHHDHNDGVVFEVEDSTSSRAEIEDENIHAFNGIIHVIDSKC